MIDARVVEEEIPAALAGQRIDRVVSFMSDLSRREALELIAAGLVLVDGDEPDKPSVKVDVGATVKIDIPARDEELAADSSVEFAVVHHDDQVIVIDKPAHLVVHPGSGVTGKTLVNGLLARFPELVDVGEPDRPGIVHRLDKGTSGLLMVARTSDAHRSLTTQLARRTVARRYRSLVLGAVEADSGLIDAPLGRSPRDPTRRAVVADGRPARTRYEVLARFSEPERSEIECRLETGRTHQIRAHLAAIGHPVVGDDRYGGADPELGLTRPFLHAAHLGFEHPKTGADLSFDSELPTDLAVALDSVLA